MKVVRNTGSTCEFINEVPLIIDVLFSKLFPTFLLQTHYFNLKLSRNEPLE